VKPTYPAGFTQGAGAGWGMTKRVFTQWGLIGVSDEQPALVVIEDLLAPNHT